MNEVRENCSSGRGARSDGAEGKGGKWNEQCSIQTVTHLNTHAVLECLSGSLLLASHF